MKKFKTLLIACVVMVCMTIMCAACGGQTNTTEPDPGKETNAETTVASGEVDETTAEIIETTEEVTEEVTEPVTEELTTEEITTEEVTTEEPTTEEPTTEEPTTEEPTTEAPVVTGISAKVKGSHYIGDNLSAGDFTITVTYSDGSTKKNPAGWSADILNLAGASTTITVSYQGHTATVTVEATERPAQQAPANDGGGESANNGGSGNEFPYEFDKVYVGDDCVYIFFNFRVDHGDEWYHLRLVEQAYKDHFGKAPACSGTVGSMEGFSNGSTYNGTVYRMDAAGYDLTGVRRFWP